MTEGDIWKSFLVIARIKTLICCLTAYYPTTSIYSWKTPEGNLSKVMQAFQTSYTLYFNKRHGRTGHVFEQRYKAMVVDKDNCLLQVSRYIILIRSAPK